MCYTRDSFWFSFILCFLRGSSLCSSSLRQVAAAAGRAATSVRGADRPRACVADHVYTCGDAPRCGTRGLAEWGKESPPPALSGLVRGSSCRCCSVGVSSSRRPGRRALGGDGGARVRLLSDSHAEGAGCQPKDAWGIACVAWGPARLGRLIPLARRRVLSGALLCCAADAGQCGERTSLLCRLFFDRIFNMRALQCLRHLHLSAHVITRESASHPCVEIPPHSYTRQILLSLLFSPFVAGFSLCCSFFVFVFVFVHTYFPAVAVAYELCHQHTRQ
mmetsp:Transcript_7286/g.22045  ORF Transcript_7286/g.22045 Transcript_7286/m.22045 type:complete len:276 (+) Transcript_7286:548-1375(+)